MADQAESPFYNKTMDRTAVRQPISKLTVHFGIAYATNILDQVKILGFQQATKASVSLGIDDLSTVPSKGWLVQDAERQGYIPDQYHLYGSLHAVEKLRQSIEAWYATSECLKREMNPNFRMVDPLNPVHMMSFSGARGSISQVHQLPGMRGPMSDPRGQVIDLPIRRNLREGLSLTEYVISCYGARKGVVDTAVRTSDAGYPTRRPVEVVQHIVVRKRDCGTLKGIALNIVEGRRESIRTVSQRRPIGRVLADNVYSNERCVAARNQDIGDGLAGNLVNAIQPIYIRSPLTCRTIFWICQLCYGWSLAHHDLVELGEAVGIVAGQSIGEPGTQSTLRTFHTGGVSTGDIAEYVRTPFNGIVNLDEGSVYPTRTRHGHPAWVCRHELPLLIQGSSDTNSVAIPARSLVMIRNNQYVDSQQIIAEVRAKEFPLKERIQKSIYPNLEGETHRSRFICHSQKRMNDTTHVARDTGHIWILSGTSKYYGENCFFCQDQDRIDEKCYFELNKYNRSHRSEQIIADLDLEVCSRYVCGQEIRTILNCFLNQFSSLVTTYLLTDFVMDFFTNVSPLSTKHIKGCGGPPITSSSKKWIFVLSDNYEYRPDTSGIEKYGAIRVEPIDQVTYILGGNLLETSSLRSRDTEVTKGGNSLSIPEERYVTDEPSSSICITDRSFVGGGMRLTPSITSQASGSVQIGKTGSSTETRILLGYAYRPKNLGALTNIPKEKDIIIPPGESIFDDLTFEDWVCSRLVTSKKGKISVLVRPVINYNRSDSSLVQTGFFLKTSEPSECARIQPTILYGNKDYVDLSNKKVGIQLFWTCLGVYQGKNLSQPLFSEGWTHAFFGNVVTHDSFNTFLQIGLSRVPSDSLTASGSGRLLEQPALFENPFPICHDRLSRDDLIVKHQSTIHLISERGASLFTLSPPNTFRDILWTDMRHNKTIKDCILDREFNFQACLGGISGGDLQGNRHENNHSLGFEKKPSNNGRFASLFGSRKNGNLGLPGNFLGLLACLSHYLDYDPVISGSNQPVNYSTDTLEHETWYSIDEAERVVKYRSISLLSDTFVQNDTGSVRLKLGLLIGENRHFFGEKICLKSGQVVTIHEKHFFLRMGKPYLINRGAIIHRSSGSIVREGDTLITLPYDRSKPRDIIQGLPKVEQSLESRSIGSVPTRVVDAFEKRSEGILESIGNFRSHFLSAGASMEHCQLVLIDQIQRVHGSQGVQVVDKHIEIIIRQLTSKVILSEDGITNVFLPGELIGSSQAQRMNRSLKKSVSYEPTILGMTKASLNTTSFLSEASFQETTRVPARAASRGRTDWPKGLKENVILGGIVPIGTGSQEIFHKKNVEKRRELLVIAIDTSVFKVDGSIFINHGMDPSFQYEPSIRRRSNHILGSNTDR
uniref:DNA-directed RNA polymerase subunit beta'' n=1 Tax=Schizaea pectinata TaxID=148576 RepID=A0A286QHH2_9MONI|nr:RNA polymerase b''-subunit [Schizaea pectinata]APT66054.1 RNA polymerase b''-subunit [Schizaea pectinata]